MRRLEYFKLQSQLSALLDPFEQVSFSTHDLQTLFIKSLNYVDIGTLPQAVEVSHKYLPLQDGDIVMTNDPYSGGSLLSSPTLTLGVGNKFTKNTVPAEFLIASRVSLPPKVGPFKTIDDEGLRIPPSPLYHRGQLNGALLDALKSHPQISSSFIEAITTEASRLLQAHKKLKLMMAKSTIDLSKNTIKDYLLSTSQSLTKSFEELGEGSGSVEIVLGDDEFIKLKVDHIDAQFHFDFTGTSIGQRLFMTDAAVFGAIVGTVLSYLKIDSPINSGAFSLFDVRAPKGSQVNSGFPRSVFLGHTDGMLIISNLVSRALGQIHKRWARGSHGTSHCAYELTFDSGKTLSDHLLTGAGATATSQQNHGIEIVQRRSQSDSIELLESEFPIQYLSYTLRDQSAGTGLLSGGRGLVKSFRLLEPAKLKWNYICPLQKPEGAEGGKAALGTLIQLTRLNGDIEDLPCTGELSLLKGDSVSIQSAGGGGYGAKP